MSLDLVWRSVADALGSLKSTWYEHGVIVDKLNAFRRVRKQYNMSMRRLTHVLQELFTPIVKRLGFDYPDGESVDLRQLRTKAIEQAADAGDKLYVLFWR